MRKLISFLFVTFTICSNPLFAQVDTSTTEKLLQYVSQKVDKSQITSGYLAEYGLPAMGLAAFNGMLTDSNKVDMDVWRTLLTKHVS
jgi:hypothetical protein